LIAGQLAGNQPRLARMKAQSKDPRCFMLRHVVSMACP
jgi:hypothetical protein